ncbi:putative hydrolase of the HAD superfamily [Scopulibacillus darangshiensis]|uniref:Putative hydrolase of the HAD superfamily n=1 Tax=Scopulibacillus darangshiensis TaxID=442528 RepID=A0A4R2P5C0_9BACL|nr:HAD family hydrolase [Scopulibacillus darangshiensis]TCP29972.1 putative hydrolase of the HAD superfamily [Scopulibacillus darangshiensis]
MIKAVIFDFDGLIIDTESAWYEAYRHVLEGHGVTLPLEIFGRAVGTHDSTLYDYIHSQGKDGLEREVIEQETAKHYHTLMVSPALRDGVLDYLEAAKAAGLKIGLASSSGRDWVQGYLEKLNILSFFDTIKTRDDVKQVKPDPELYIKAVGALDVRQEDVLAFEDSLNGLKAARAAGLACVIVPNPVTGHLQFEDFSHRLSSMKEMTFDQLVKMLEEK